jgi:hypothetical protein
MGGIYLKLITVRGSQWLEKMGPDFLTIMVLDRSFVGASESGPSQSRLCDELPSQ